VLLLLLLSRTLGSMDQRKCRGHPCTNYLFLLPVVDCFASVLTGKKTSLQPRLRQQEFQARAALVPSNMCGPVGLIQAILAVNSSPGAHSYTWISARYVMLTQQNGAGSRLLQCGEPC
jgi:hypothetical protein